MIGIFTGAVAIAALVSAAASGASRVDHGAYDALLRKYVATDGVRYQAWKENAADVEALSAYLRRLEGIDPETLPREEALAYWINVYNAVTLELVLEHYPVKSIKDIGGRFRSPWKKELFQGKSKRLTLNEIENDVIRPGFEEPRIHFALNCASEGCPPLRAEAFVGERLDAQLEEQTVAFLADPERNWIDKEGTLHLSKVFDWYESDFTGGGTVVDWVRPYLPALPEGDVRVKHEDYDWSLNEAAD